MGQSNGKGYRNAREKIDSEKNYETAAAVEACLGSARTKFDETVEVAFRLGVDPRHADQMVRGNASLPHGTGKKVRVAVFAKGEKQTEAKDAGADIVGGEDLVERVQKEGFTDFDVAVATPDMMGQVGKLGRVLGPRGLMPNPKIGTVTFDVGKAVTEVKAGRIEFRVDKDGNVHLPVGKVSFGADKIKDNLLAITDTLIKAKPSSSKGTYLKNVSISTTMGPGIKLDTVDLQNATKAM